MLISDSLGIFSQIINFVIFIYFTLVLIKFNMIDVWGLLVSAFGLFSSIVVSIISVLERRSGR